jgi:hypothetical protein
MASTSHKQLLFICVIKTRTNNINNKSCGGLYVYIVSYVEHGTKQTDSACLIISLHYNTCRSRLLTKDDMGLSSLICRNFFNLISA